MVSVQADLLMLVICLAKRIAFVSLFLLRSVIVYHTLCSEFLLSDCGGYHLLSERFAFGTALLIFFEV